jgi:glyoxylase-like metal-dependent hydrolase (beta-lactamase superfamily II)
MDKSAEIFILNINYDEDDPTLLIHPVIIADGRERVLVDCGYPGQLPRLEFAAESSGVAISDLTAIIITHHDYDHCGALYEIREKYPRVGIMASELDAPHIDGTKRSPRLDQAEASRETLSPEERADADELQRTIEAMKPVKVDRLLHDGDTFPWCGGTEIIATPGHMPGHISVYVRPHRTLITGDALIATGGRLRMANPQYATDIVQARASIRKLTEYDIDTFICYHGGRVRTNLSLAENRHLINQPPRHT